MRLAWFIGLGLTVMPAAIRAGDAASAYRVEVDAWRKAREAKLKGEDGWLSVCGLHWLREGRTKIGSDPANDIVLPGHAPAVLGALELERGVVRFEPAGGVGLTLGGKPFHAGVVRSDADGEPDILAAGDIKLIVLKRGKRHALRVKDKRSPLRESFAGLRWYPAREDWKIRGRFVGHPKPVKLAFDTIVGETEIEESPGYVVFEREGKEYQLTPAKLRDGRLWFVFRDGTSGRTTHGGARQLETDAPRDGFVELDFNKAVNLPCAYIPYATCPLAPPCNRLKVAIEAGELKYEPRPSPAPAAVTTGGR